MDGKQIPLKFRADKAPDGYPIATLTFNENRPNVSFLTKRTGFVDITKRIPTDAMVKTLPGDFPSFIYRNYAVIKDGLVNIDRLPVRLSEDTYNELLAHGCPDDVFEGAEGEPDKDGTTYILNLRALPVINQQMIKDVSAKDYFERKFALTSAQAVAKVYSSYAKELLPEKTSEGFAVLYGEDEAAWLKEQGITEHSGFAPKSVQAEATDFYMGKELKVNLKGLSSLPSLNAVRKQIEKGKLNAGGQLMKPTIDKVEAFLTSDAYTGAADKDAVLKAWLDGNAKDAKATTRKLIYDIAQTTFALIVGQVWFNEFESLDDNELDIEVQFTDDDPRVALPCKAEMREIEVKI